MLSGSTGVTLPNDVLLVQLVRGALGKAAKTRGLPRPNVSSCGFVVTQHGSVRVPEERNAIEEVTHRLPSIRGVENKVKTAPTL